MMENNLINAFNEMNNTKLMNLKNIQIYYVWKSMSVI